MFREAKHKIGWNNPVATRHTDDREKQTGRLTSRGRAHLIVAALSPYPVDLAATD